MRFFVSIILFFLLLITPQKTFADEGWVIDNFKSDIAIQASGQVRVVETIEIDFGTLNKHGIYREIPYVYQSNGEKTYTEISVEEILQNDQKAKYETSKNEGYVSLKIGDPDKTISGKTVYTITYTAKGVLRSFAEHDELYWNVTGNKWPVTINRVEAIVTLPKEGMTRVTCYEGYEGSQATCKSSIESPQLARFESTGPLDEARGLTTVVGYTKGLVPVLTVERPKSFWEKFMEWPSLATLALAIAAGVSTIFYLWNKNGRDYWFAQNIFGKKHDPGVVKPIGAHETVTVEFTPPEDLRPAELGVLIDEKADTKDVVATIIDLATRGYLSITEIPKSWVFGKVDYQLKKKNKEHTGLLRYESLLLDNLFKTGDEVKLSTLKNTFYDELAQVKKALYTEVVEKHLFNQDPEKVRTNYLGFGILFIVFGGFIIGTAVSSELVIIADIAFGMLLSGLILMVMSQFMPRRTAYGRELYRRVRGYHLFIDKAEKYRQQFFEKKNMFNQVLPYAIVFGLTEKFARQMQDMGVKPSTSGWYSGAHHFNAATFGSNMNDFSNSLSTAIASTPSSSGGFSGGGSSGGGFGGGGGGSW